MIKTTIATLLLLALASCGYQRVQTIALKRPSVELQSVYFGLNRISVKKSNIKAMEANIEWLKGNPNELIILEGHCDERGSNKYNMDLGDRRAKWVKAFLINRGVSPRKIVTISYGKQRPEDKAHNEGAWSRNRRVVFRLGR